MNKLFVSILSLCLLACSSKGVQPTPRSADRSEVSETISSVAESAFQESSGTLNLAFDAKGNWLKITTRGSASLVEDSPAARDSALMIATMRAKRTVTEFLNNDVKSAKALNRLSKSYAKNFQTAENQEVPSSEDSEAMPAEGEGGRRSKQSRQAQRFAETLTERIQEHSAAIIKGGYVSYQALEDGRVVVELTVACESIGAAKQISRLMSGVFK